jgi:hypothetical protein
MYYTIYKVTNKLNGKIYIGSHKTKKLDDGYMGSGTYLKRSIEKHGLENFNKEILHVFETSDEMYKKEAEIVNEDFLMNENSYNMKIGGFGGFNYLNSIENNPTHKKEHGLKCHEATMKKYGVLSLNELGNNKKITSERLKILHKEGKVKYDTFTGKKHSEETKRKMRESHKRRHSK